MRPREPVEPFRDLSQQGVVAPSAGGLGGLHELGARLPRAAAQREQAGERDVRGHVLRVTPAAQNVQFGMAVYLDSYEYLTAAESTASSHDFERISCLHQREAPFSRQSRVFKSA